MSSAYYHLAQVNIAKARAALDDPLMHGFVSQLPSINALADASPGFVWRMQSDSGDNLYVRPYDDPLIIFNLSVWESVEALKQYVYRSGHAGPVRDRRLWFEKMEEDHVALWWIPAGYIPSVDEAKERLDYRRRHGDSAIAFSFAHAFPMPAEPDDADARSGEASVGMSYHGRTFALRARSERGDCGPGTRFRYGQRGARVWATYEGDGVRFGTLVATSDADGRLRGCYHHLTSTNEWRTGRYTAMPERSPNARIRLRERWRTPVGAGESVLEELAIE